MTYNTLIFERDGNLAVIKLNRPERLNAATPEMFDELRDVLERLRPDGARALVLTGEGRAFCSGADLGGRAFNEESPGTASRRSLQKLSPVSANGTDLRL